MNEQHLTSLVERVGDTLDPDVGALVAGGAARGRARRRRHRAGAIAGGIAAVAAVGALGYALVPGDGGAATDGSSVASEPTTAPSSAPADRDRHFGPDPGKMGWALGDLLEGRVTQRRAWDEAPSKPTGFQAGSVLLDGARVTILLERRELPVSGCGEQPPGAPCDVVPGGFLTGGTHEEPASGGGPTGIFASTASYLTDDGFAITATAWNAPDEKHVEPVMADPILTEAQLAEIVQNPDWLDEHQ